MQTFKNHYLLVTSTRSVSSPTTPLSSWRAPPVLSVGTSPPRPRVTPAALPRGTPAWFPGRIPAPRFSSPCRSTPAASPALLRRLTPASPSPAPRRGRPTPLPLWWWRPGGDIQYTWKLAPNSLLNLSWKTSPSSSYKISIKRSEENTHKVLGG